MWETILLDAQVGVGVQFIKSRAAHAPGFHRAEVNAILFRFSNRSTIGIIYNGSQDTAHMDGWGTGVVEGKLDCC